MCLGEGDVDERHLVVGCILMGRVEGRLKHGINVHVATAVGEAEAARAEKSLCSWPGTLVFLATPRLPTIYATNSHRIFSVGLAS